MTNTTIKGKISGRAAADLWFHNEHLIQAYKDDDCVDVAGHVDMVMLGLPAS